MIPKDNTKRNNILNSRKPTINPLKIEVIIKLVFI